MRMKSQHRICILLFLLIASIPLAFFARFESFSDHLEEELHFDGSLANAAKHAYAAGWLYESLRIVGISADVAEDAILNLGEINEYLETIFKVSEPDSTREIMKDIYNNQAGIVAAEWVRGQENASLRDVVIRLAQEKVLAVSSYKVPHSGPEAIEDYPQSVEHASHWFCEQQKTIKSTVAKGLAQATGIKAK